VGEGVAAVVARSADGEACRVSRLSPLKTITRNTEANPSNTPALMTRCIKVMLLTEEKAAEIGLSVAGIFGGCQWGLVLRAGSSWGCRRPLVVSLSNHERSSAVD
jgi:hypothetical protein